MVIYDMSNIIVVGEKRTSEMERDDFSGLLLLIIETWQMNRR